MRSVALRIEEKRDAHRPVPVLIGGIARVQEVLLPKDAGVLKLFMVSVRGDMRSLGLFGVGLVALCYLEQ